MEAINVGFSVMNCQAKPRLADMTCSKFLPKEGAEERWGHRMKPGSKVKLYTYDTKTWHEGETLSLSGGINRQFFTVISILATSSIFI